MGLVVVGLFFAVLAAAAYLFLAVLQVPLAIGLVLSLVLAVGASAVIQRGDAHSRRIWALLIAAIVLIGVPGLAVSHQNDQRVAGDVRASAAQQESIAAGITTQAKIDEYNRKTQETIDAHRAYDLAHCGSSPNCWIQGNQGFVAYALLVGLVFAIIIGRSSAATTRA